MGLDWLQSYSPTTHKGGWLLPSVFVSGSACQHLRSAGVVARSSFGGHRLLPFLYHFSATFPELKTLPQRLALKHTHTHMHMHTRNSSEILLGESIVSVPRPWIPRSGRVIHYRRPQPCANPEDPSSKSGILCIFLYCCR